MQNKNLLSEIQNLSEDKKMEILESISDNRNYELYESISDINEKLPKLIEEYNKIATECGLDLIEEIRYTIADYYRKKDGFEKECIIINSDNSLDWYTSDC